MENKCAYFYMGNGKEYFICTAKHVKQCKHGNNKCKLKMITVDEIRDRFASLFGSDKKAEFYECLVSAAKEETLFGLKEQMNNQIQFDARKFKKLQCEQCGELVDAENELLMGDLVFCSEGCWDMFDAEVQGSVEE